MMNLAMPPKINYFLLCNVLGVSLIPSFIYVYFGFTSLSVGLIISVVLSSGAIILRYRLHAISRRGFKVAVVISLISCFGAVVAISTEFSQKVFSLVPFILIVFAALIFARMVERTPLEIFVNTIFTCLVILILIGWLGYFNLTAIGPYAERPKPVFPFSEQSHYALVTGGFLFMLGFQLTVRRLLFAILNLFLLALLFPNMTLLLFVVLVIIQQMFRMKRSGILILLASLGALCVSVLAFEDSYSYFTQRLDFKSSDNATTLVWIQGVELINKFIFWNGGLGLGFQNLGNNEATITDASSIIYLVAGDYLNLDDGGFLAAKIVSELGVIGAIIVAAYLFIIGRYFSLASKLSKAKILSRPKNKLIAGEIEGKKLIYLGMACAIFVEMFFRGYGYFSPGVFFSIVGYIAYVSYKPCSRQT